MKNITTVNLNDILDNNLASENTWDRGRGMVLAADFARSVNDVKAPEIPGSGDELLTGQSGV